MLRWRRCWRRKNREHEGGLGRRCVHAGSAASRMLHTAVSAGKLLHPPLSGGPCFVGPALRPKHRVRGLRPSPSALLQPAGEADQAKVKRRQLKQEEEAESQGQSEEQSRGSSVGGRGAACSGAFLAMRGRGRVGWGSRCSSSHGCRRGIHAAAGQHCAGIHPWRGAAGAAGGKGKALCRPAGAS